MTQSIHGIGLQKLKQQNPKEDISMDQPESRGQRDDTKHEDRKETGDEHIPASLPFTEEEYKSLYFKTFNKMGRAVIVNNLINSQKNDGRLKEKLDKLKTTFERLQFEPLVVKDDVIPGKVDNWEYGDLTTESVKKLMNKASCNDFSNHYCVFIIILTYGKDGVLEFRDTSTKAEDKVELSTLQENFKGRQTLNMKPKIFFIQAGDRPVEKSDDAKGKEQVVTVRKIPREADLFTYLYDLPTFVKQEHDDVDREFMFVDTLTEALEEHVIKPRQMGLEPTEVSKLTIRMNAMIEDKLRGESFQFNDGDMKIPCVTDLLTKRMNFNHGDPKKRKEC